MAITGGMTGCLCGRSVSTLNKTLTSSRPLPVNRKNCVDARAGRRSDLRNLKSLPPARRRTHCQALDTEQEEDVKRSDSLEHDTKKNSENSLQFLTNELEESSEGSENGSVSTGTAVGGSLLAAIATLGFVAAVAGGGYYFRDTINHYLLIFEEIIEGHPLSFNLIEHPNFSFQMCFSSFAY